MGLDYFVRRNCPAQETLGTDGFLSHMQRRRQLAMFRPGATMIVDGREVAVAIPPGGVGVQMRGPQGTTSSRLQHGDLEALDASLARFQPACHDCPANLSGAPFGCYGFVSYPISAATELWLMAKIKLGGVDAAVATTTLRQLGITGDRSAELRTRGQMFFEADAPQGLIWNLQGGGELVVTTDLVCDLVLFQAPGNPGLVPILCAILGLCPPGHGLQQHAREPAEIERHADPARLAPTSPQEHSLTTYVRALLHASQRGLGVHADG